MFCPPVWFRIRSVAVVRVFEAFIWVYGATWTASSIYIKCLSKRLNSIVRVAISHAKLVTTFFFRRCLLFSVTKRNIFSLAFQSRHPPTELGRSEFGNGGARFLWYGRERRRLGIARQSIPPGMAICRRRKKMDYVDFVTLGCILLFPSFPRHRQSVTETTISPHPSIN